jgi:hypothetical protein
MTKRLVGNKIVSINVLDKLRQYFREIPDNLTAREAIDYAIFARALDGESGAYKEASRDEIDTKLEKEATAKELLKVARLK